MGLPLSSLSLAAIFCGAGLGALLRVWFNTVSVGLSAIVPMGTLISNLLGCYLVGIALAYFTSHPSVSPEWRLFIITGFLGGLTTFSSFSAEVVSPRAWTAYMGFGFGTDACLWCDRLNSFRYLDLPEF